MNRPLQPKYVAIVAIVAAVAGSIQSVAQELRSRSIDVPPRSFAIELSPDGQSFAYTERGDLVVTDLRTSQPRKLTARSQNDTKFVSGFAWARAGGELFYLQQPVSGGDSELLAVSVSDGTSRVVAPRRNFRGIADSSPDGRNILVWNGDTDKPRQLSLLSREDGSVRKLLDGQEGLATFSVSGRHIAYEQSSDADGTDIRIMNIDGTADRPLVASAADEHLLEWTPDGRSLLYTSDRAGTNDIWILDVTDGRPVGEARQLKKDVGGAISLGVTPRGDLYYRVWSKDQLFTVPLDAGTGMATGPAARLSTPNLGGHAAPAWSPDGRTLAFKTRVRTEFLDWKAISLVIVATNTLRTIVPDLPRLDGQTVAGLPGWLDWSADGRALIADGALYPFGLRPKGAHRIDPADGESTMIISKPHKTVSVNQAKWLPDGRSVVYLESWTALVVRDLETGTERRLYDLKTTAPTLDSLALSPDRKSVAFRDHRSGTILMAPLAGGDVRVLATAKGPASWPAAALAWSADGRFVVFADSADKKRYELWRVPVAGGESERLGFATERQITELAMHPAGRSIVVVMPDGSDPPGHYVIDRLVPGSGRTKSLHPHH